MNRLTVITHEVQTLGNQIALNLTQLIFRRCLTAGDVVRIKRRVRQTTNRASIAIKGDPVRTTHHNFVAADRGRAIAIGHVNRASTNRRAVRAVIHRNAVIVHHGVTRGHAAVFAQVNVLGQVKDQIRAVLADDNVVILIAEVDRTARCHVFASCTVGTHIPALRSMRNRVVDGAFARATDVVAHGDVAILINSRIATQHTHNAVGDIANHGLRGEQLRAVDGIGAACFNTAGRDVGDGTLFAGCTHADCGTGIGTRKTTVSDPTYRCIFSANRHIGDRPTTEGHIVSFFGNCTVADGHRRGSLGVNMCIGA